MIKLASFNLGKRGKSCQYLVLLRERSDRKGPRAPEAKFGSEKDLVLPKRNSGFKVFPIF
jgi:hypothetical protein